MGLPTVVKPSPLVTRRELPSDLKQRRQWVAYGFLPLVPGEKKRRKVPYQPRLDVLMEAKTNDPRTWGTLAQAKRAVAHFGLAGPGFVLTATDRYVACDWDDCRDPETGAIDVQAWREASRLRSYTEVSISQTGIHVLALGIKPGTRCKVKAFEMYEHGRGLLLTGDHLADTPVRIMPAAREIDELYAKRFPPEPPKPARSVVPDGDWTRGPLVAEGGRNDAMFRLASAMRAAGLEPDAIETQLRAANERRCRPPLSDRELLSIVRSVSKYPAGQTA